MSALRFTEVWERGLIRQFAKLLSPLKGSEGSNPSTSATFRLTRRLKIDILLTMNKKITSILFGVTLFLTAVAVSAQSVNLAWNASPSPEVNRYKVYAAKGTNTVFAVGNTNAAATVTVTVTNQLTASFTNLSVGAWTFTATALSTNNLESVNSNTVWTNVVPGAVINFRFAP